MLMEILYLLAKAFLIMMIVSVAQIKLSRKTNIRTITLLNHCGD